MNISKQVLLGVLTRAPAILLIATLSCPAIGAVTNDRDYQFGDAGSSDGSLGATVAEGNPVGFIFSGDVRTADETGPSSSGGSDLGAFLDLLVPGATDLSHSGATYTDTSTRPLAGAGEFGLNFDGVDDVMSGIALNLPSELATRVSPQTYPFEYIGLTTRGLQMWVRPSQAGLDAGVRQTVLMDTVAAGGVAITAGGLWTQINDGHTGESDIEATLAASGDTWHHVMHHGYQSGTTGAPKVVPGTGSTDLGVTSVLYVNGMAVSANNDFPAEGDFDAGDRVGVLSIGAAELADQDEDPTTADFGDYFNGTIDDLEMYVFGDNSDSGGQDYGTFNLLTDNDWIANEIANTVPGGVLLPGDINRDGAVTLAGDVPAFVAGWLKEKRLEGSHNVATVGDWETWGWGDMNLDGIVDLDDWVIVNAANPALGTAILGAPSAVPEPSSLALISLATILGASYRRRKSLA